MTSLHRAALLPLLLLAACGIDVRDRVERRWVGPLTAANPTACPPTRGTLSLRDGHVVFAPDDGTWVLDGRANAQTLTATRSRLTPDRKSYDTRLQATWTDQTVAGTYTTPFCTYAVALNRI